MSTFTITMKSTSHIHTASGKLLFFFFFFFWRGDASSEAVPYLESLSQPAGVTYMNSADIQISLKYFERYCSLANHWVSFHLYIGVALPPGQLPTHISWPHPPYYSTYPPSEPSPPSPPAPGDPQATTTTSIPRETTAGGTFITLVPPAPATSDAISSLSRTTESSVLTGGNGSTTSRVVPLPTGTSSSIVATMTSPTNASSPAGSGFEGNRTLIITLSAVFSAVGFLLIFGGILLCYRLKKGRLPFHTRGLTPIDDEEIESWKANRALEKSPDLSGGALARTLSVVSAKKAPSVIVYQNTGGNYTSRPSGEYSRKSYQAKRSIEMPPVAVLARAPNSRPGLTDDTVQGDEAFLPSPKRQPSRLSKPPPISPRHMRTKSSRSSVSVGSFRDHWYQYYTDVNPTPRTSNEYYHPPQTPRSYQDRRHRRKYSASSNPPRISFDDEFLLGGLSPRPLVHQQSNIGQAIG
jgi:hypothetical protein